MIKTIILVACITATPLHAKDIRCLAENIYHEARGEPVSGQLAVAHVVLNRVEDSRFPDTICAVVRQPNQFHWVARKPRIKEQEAWQRAKQLAEHALALYAQGVDRSNGAVFFQRSSKLQPYHEQHVARIGNHSFFQ